jgi:hypothetical protein
MHESLVGYLQQLPFVWKKQGTVLRHGFSHILSPDCKPHLALVTTSPFLSSRTSSSSQCPTIPSQRRQPTSVHMRHGRRL